MSHQSDRKQAWQEYPHLNPGNSNTFVHFYLDASYLTTRLLQTFRGHKMTARNLGSLVPSQPSSTFDIHQTQVL